MIEGYKQTQSDFQGQKKQNTQDFKNYILEGIAGHRALYLPVISGWQFTLSFERTIFVAFDEENPHAMYGELYLPKDPIMQADGQTQNSSHLSSLENYRSNYFRRFRFFITYSRN